MKPVKVYLPEDMIDLLQRQAEYHGIGTSELIRQRLSSDSDFPSLTTTDFYEAVTKIRRKYGYGLDRQQAESVVAAVLAELCHRSKND